MSQTGPPRPGTCQAVNPGCAGSSVHEHDAVRVAAGRDAITVANVHPDDVKSMLTRALEAAPMATPLDIDYAADGQDRVAEICDMQARA
jgi:hypothetical protein